MTKRPYRAGVGYTVDGGLLNKMLADIENLKRATGVGPRLGFASPSIVSVRNETGADRDRGEVVRIEVADNIDNDVGIFLEDDFFKYTQYKAHAPREGHAKDVHAILSHALENGSAKYGKAIVHGVAPARVDITDAAHRYAKMVEDEFLLESTDEATAIKIIEQNVGTGVKRCRVFMGGGAGLGKLTAGKMLTEIGINETKEMQVYEWSGASSSDRMDVFLHPIAGTPVSAGKWVFVMSVPGLPDGAEAVIIAAECEDEPVMQRFRLSKMLVRLMGWGQ